MVAAILALLSAFGGGFLTLLGTVAPGIAATIGDTFVKLRQTEVEADKVGAGVARTYLQAVTDANRVRAEARAKEGAWGPLGIITFAMGMPLAIHVGAVVADSLPLLLRVSWLWFIPYVDLGRHVPCRCVAALPDKFQDLELEVARALFYVAPPSAAAVVVARAFRK